VDIKGVGLLATWRLHGFDQGHFRTNQQITLGLLLPIGLSAVFVYAVVVVLGWWRPVFVDLRPVQRWVWVVPIVLAISIAVAIDYGALADKGASTVVLLLIATLLVRLCRGGHVPRYRRDRVSRQRLPRRQGRAVVKHRIRSGPSDQRDRRRRRRRGRPSDRRQLRGLQLLSHAPSIGRAAIAGDRPRTL